MGKTGPQLPYCLMASRRDRRMEIMEDFCTTQLMKSKHPGHKGFAIRRHHPKSKGWNGVAMVMAA